MERVTERETLRERERWRVCAHTYEQASERERTPMDV